MRNAAILGGVGLVVAGALILLNPRLLIPATIGLLLGVGLRRYWVYRKKVTAPDYVASTQTRSSRRWDRIVLLVIATLFFVVTSTVVLFLGAPAMSPQPVVEAALTFRGTYDSARSTWTGTQRFELSDEAVTEALRILAIAGRQVPKDPTPDEVATLLGAEFGSDSWTVGLVTGRPTLTQSVEIGMPEGGPWSYTVNLPVGAAYGRVLEIRPGDDGAAVLDTPRHLVLQAAPPVTSSESLPGDARETLRIDMPDDSTAVRLEVAPGWARHDVTAWAMTLSLGSLAQVGVGAIVTVMAAAFGTTVWARMRSVWPRRGPAAGPAAAPAVPAPDTQRPIKILFLAANPTDTDPLRLDEEIRAIDEELLKAEFRDRFEIEQQWAVRVGDLQEALLRHEPDIVHFSGHGASSSQIVLESETGQSQVVPQDDLSGLFSILQDNIRLVVLNACYSELQAKAIGRHIDCVVGMTTAVGDDAAIEFATAFYRAIGYGRDVQTAFDLGTNQIGLQDLPDVDTPHLLAKTARAAHFSFVPQAEGGRSATKRRPRRP
jgi:CHAT domain